MTAINIPLDCGHNADSCTQPDPITRAQTVWCSKCSEGPSPPAPPRSEQETCWHREGLFCHCACKKREAALEQSARDAAKKEREGLRGLFIEVAQLLDGWHQDGTAWSEWDESVRARVSGALKGLEP